MFYISNNLRAPTLKNTSRWLLLNAPMQYIASCLIINLLSAKKWRQKFLLTDVMKSHFSCFFSKDNEICGFLRVRDTLTWNISLIIALIHWKPTKSWQIQKLMEKFYSIFFFWLPGMHVFEDCWWKVDKAVWDGFYWLYLKKKEWFIRQIIYYSHFAYCETGLLWLIMIPMKTSSFCAW